MELTHELTNSAGKCTLMSTNSHKSDQNAVQKYCIQFFSVVTIVSIAVKFVYHEPQTHTGLGQRHGLNCGRRMLKLRDRRKNWKP